MSFDYNERLVLNDRAGSGTEAGGKKATLKPPQHRFNRPSVRECCWYSAMYA